MIFIPYISVIDNIYIWKSTPDKRLYNKIEKWCRFYSVPWWGLQLDNDGLGPADSPRSGVTVGGWLYIYPNSLASFSSWACCRLRATWAAITLCLSAIRVHLAHTQSRHLQIIRQFIIMDVKFALDGSRQKIFWQDLEWNNYKLLKLNQTS